MAVFQKPIERLLYYFAAFRFVFWCVEIWIRCVKHAQILLLPPLHGLWYWQVITLQGLMECGDDGDCRNQAPFAKIRDIGAEVNLCDVTRWLACKDTFYYLLEITNDIAEVVSWRVALEIPRSPPSHPEAPVRVQDHETTD
jgi:hypothetical protein